jgi:DNA mismatch repair ATPase MutS
MLARVEEWAQTTRSGDLAELEVLASLGGFATDHLGNGYCWPELDPDASAAIEAEGLGHPLIQAARRRVNDFTLSGAGRMVLVTGSNMAGKSSFLRTVGVNTLLAQAGAPVCAARLKMQPCRLSTSIQVTDAPEQGLSRFYAEVKRIRRILDE